MITFEPNYDVLSNRNKVPETDRLKIHCERWRISSIWKNTVKIHDDLNNKLFALLFLNVKYLVGGETCVIDIKQYERK